MDDEQLHPILARRRLSAAIRQLREAAQLTQAAVAALLGWSETKVIRMETGHVGVSKSDLTVLAHTYGVTNRGQIDALAALAVRGTRQPWASYRDVYDADTLLRLAHEDAAGTIRQFDHALIPAILRTEAYARAVQYRFAPPGTPPHRTERRIQACLRQQALHERPHPPTMSYVLDQAVIDRPVGATPADLDITLAQLEHLKQMAAHPHINVRILPYSHGLHLGLSSPYVIFGFADDGEVLFVRDGRRRRTDTDSCETEQYLADFVALEAATDPYDLRPIDAAIARLTTAAHLQPS
ncbi:hypothetical protein Prum_069190 [Phytohabitans rumicis]|uniref:HTH cro/C1-type domain-containing protein n=1 Tax=Phytohabitans rumicis TaxID=1076125 RepID=A0A6V8LGS4_9ACTN|nr:hypothetical protein Prum_069190 [Phytohabitans rumicis]